MHDVIVVGGGPTGFVTALGLAQAGVKVCLIEAEAGINDSPRACVYHWSMLDGLERLGIREEAERIGYTKDDYLWFVKRTGERLPYDSLQQLRQAMFKTVPHLMRLDQIEASDGAAALKALAARGGAADKAAFKSPVEDFYLTNPIARASAVMAECSRLASGQILSAAE